MFIGYDFSYYYDFYRRKFYDLPRFYCTSVFVTLIYNCELLLLAHSRPHRLCL